MSWRVPFLTIGAALLLSLAGSAQAQVPSQNSVIELIQRARTALTEGDPAEALRLADLAIALDPAYREAWRQRGRTLMLQGAYYEARQALEIALGLGRVDHQMEAWIVQIIVQSGKPEEAADRFTELDPDARSMLDPKVMIKLLRNLVDLELPVLATSVAAQWYQFAPDYATRRALKAFQEAIRGSSSRAESILRSARAVSDSSRILQTFVWRLLGDQHVAVDHPDRAEQAFVRALKITPHSLSSLRELGWVYRRTARVDEAIELWKRGLDFDPRQWQWYLWIADAHLTAGRPEEAAVAIDRLLERDAGHRLGQATRLLLFLLYGTPDQAQAYRQTLSGLAGGDVTIEIGTALSEQRQGRHRPAANRLEQLQSAYPRDEVLRRLLVDAYLGWAMGLRLHAASPAVPEDERQRSLTEATVILLRATKIEPARPEAWRDLGWAHWDREERDRAVAAFDRALSLGLAHSEALTLQIVGQMIEDGEEQAGLVLFRRWQSGADLLPIGLSLIDRNRFVAAQTILRVAWEEYSQPAAGLHYAYAGARLGVCDRLEEVLTPALANRAARTEEEDELVLFVAEACLADEEGLWLMVALDQLELSDVRFRHRLDRVLQKAVRRWRTRNAEGILGVCESLLARDPDRAQIWLGCFQAVEEARGPNVARAGLEDLVERATLDAVRRGAQGVLLLLAGDPEGAVLDLEASLTAAEGEPHLRSLVFQALVSLGRHREARTHATSVARMIAAGDDTQLGLLAAMLSRLGDTADALPLWEKLNEASPESAFYAIERARALFGLCRADEAARILRGIIEIEPTQLAYLFLAEVESARGRTQAVLEIPTTELEGEIIPRMFRIRAEAAEAANSYDIALEAAELFLAERPESIPMANMLGRALVALGEREKAATHYRSLLERNPSSYRSLRYLTQLASAAGHLDEALAQAAILADQRPWDAEAQRALAVARAENTRYHRAAKVLRRLAGQKTTDAVPILVYRLVSHCSYPGYSSAAQVSEHLRHLAAAGYKLVSTLAPGSTEDGARAMVVVASAEPAALETIDATLLEINGRAVYVASYDQLVVDSQEEAEGGWLTRLSRNGRWAIATDSLDREFELPQLFFYPSGDYGHLALDYHPGAMEKLRARVEESFSSAIAADDNGFAFASTDPLRLPGKMIPGSWNVRTLEQHLLERNPLSQARLDLAKTLSWSGQLRLANRWFGLAKASGANPGATELAWGVNALHEGDLPAALIHLRRSQSLQPESTQTSHHLQRASELTGPTFDFVATGWEDREDRRYSSIHSAFGRYLGQRLRLGLQSSFERWERGGTREEEGLRLGAGFRLHLDKARRLQAEIWNLDFDNPALDDLLGGRAVLRLPSARLRGEFSLEVARKEIETVEAIQSELVADSLALHLQSRMHDLWDLFVNLHYVDRSDQNTTWTAWGRLVRRISERPFWGVGYAYRFGDSDFDPAEYWAPEGLSQHQIYVASRGGGSFRYFLSAQAGYAEEENRNARFVWGGRLRLEYVGESVRVYAQGIYLESPTYHLATTTFGLGFTL